MADKERALREIILKTLNEQAALSIALPKLIRAKEGQRAACVC
jgi:hypothetical protein